MALRYVDCTVTINDEESLVIEYEEAGKSKEFDGQLAPDPFARMTVERMHEWVSFGLKMQQDLRLSQDAFKADDLKLIGLNLHRILFGHEKVKPIIEKVIQQFETRYEEEKQRSDPPNLRLRLRLVFKPGADRLGKLPWEFLYVPGEENPLETGYFFAGSRRELILTRYVPPVKGAVPEPVEKLKILLAVYTPAGLGEISETDLGLVETQMKAIPAQVERAENLPYDELKQKIKAVQPHIFHYVGHGEQGRLSMVKKETDPDYDEKAPDPQVRWITGAQFKNLFSDDPKPRLVFLHACKSSAAGSEDAFRGCARELVERVPAVVAMQYSISNIDAGTFAKNFYERLGAGCEIDEAVRVGRYVLGEMYPSWEHPRFGTPVVYLRNNEPLVMPLGAAAGEARGATAEPSAGLTTGIAGTRAVGAAASGTPTTPATSVPAETGEAGGLKG